MDIISDIRAAALTHAGAEGASELPLPRVQIYSLEQPTDLLPLVYEPVVCLILQGAKQTLFGNQLRRYAAGECMVVAAEVVAVAQIIEATPNRPYLAINLHLDAEIIANLLLNMVEVAEPSVPSGVTSALASDPLLEAWRRLIELLDRPSEIPLLAARFEEEILLRLLMGPQGAVLRQFAAPGSRLADIRRAMAWIRTHYAEHLAIEDMAEIARMSVSVFHRRFKAVSGQSPLQYQKQIRLTEARVRIVGQGLSAASAGFTVGYESASQFSREYRRMFGRPPQRDADYLRSAGGIR
ncbi:MAG: AraC family transcriptional regulator [Asticcacaulis sp.]|uniref:AraC family transcriptional regulator n=1 Tax=Asticcacaulis sp. TaxID=1872648 RepID=UPI0025C2AAEA|nr:AraC family transcriptional regulator [Asticcacaulis sp.]MCA1936516.1 AraC family transcriptional regulator [Asticcacaulis sp.]